MAQEVLKHLRKSNQYFKKIIFCLSNNESYTSFNKNVIQYIEYITQKLGNGPYITVDAIIEIDDKIVIVKRSNPPFGWALPGGFVNYGESLEQAVAREVKEETNLDVKNIKQFHTYSDPDRDPRFHTITTVYICKGKGKPKSGSDAKGLKLVKFNELRKYQFAFDHKRIIEDYLKLVAG
jgi:ADP-ribose pyrophosphatase YjhB (NUDIX family)